MSSGVLESVREEDFVEYFLFPEINTNENQLNFNDNELNKLLHNINNIIELYSVNYIWHKDSFKVTPRFQKQNLLFENNEGQTEELPPHLYGITHYGDNIQDEWFIVFLLNEITKKIPGIVVRVIDSDGEFLLIESSDYLPKWASPDTCEQRVYIHDGAIYLVQNSPTNTSALLSVTDAIRKIRQNPTLYKVTTDIQRCIDDRIKDYPENIADQLHKATVYVPLGVAVLLTHKPSLISAAVRAICQRDIIDMKACRAMRYFPPENRVYTNVVFSKCLYAMLVQNSYTPDRRTGWNLPQTAKPQFKSHNLGVKLACGFEILASQAKPSIDLDQDKGWTQYLESLTKKGYFQENIEGSKDHSRLLEEAKTYYTNNRDSMYVASSIGQEIINTLQTLDYSTEEFKRLEANLPESDDDSWLNISPEALDEMLTKRYGVKKLFSLNGNVNSSNFTEQINDFLEKKSDFDGIEEAPNSPPVRPKRKGGKSSKATENEEENNGGGGIDFDPDGFQSHVNNLLDLIIPEDNWESNSEMSDYEDDVDIDKNIEEMAKSKPDLKINLQSYMEQMDRELAKTSIGKSFEKKAGSGEDGFDDIEDFTPVDIDMNTVKNMVESYQSQLGGPGPATTLLNSMGIKITPENGTTTDNDKGAATMDNLNTQV